MYYILWSLDINVYCIKDKMFRKNIFKNKKKMYSSYKNASLQVRYKV